MFTSARRYIGEEGCISISDRSVNQLRTIGPSTNSTSEEKLQRPSKRTQCLAIKTQIISCFALQGLMSSHVSSYQTIPLTSNFAPIHTNIQLIVSGEDNVSGHDTYTIYFTIVTVRSTTMPSCGISVEGFSGSKCREVYQNGHYYD